MKHQLPESEYEKLIKWGNENRQFLDDFYKADKEWKEKVKEDPCTHDLTIIEDLVYSKITNDAHNHDCTLTINTIKELVDRKFDDLKVRKNIMKKIDLCLECRHIFIDLANERIDNSMLNNKSSER